MKFKIRYLFIAFFSFLFSTQIQAYQIAPDLSGWGVHPSNDGNLSPQTIQDIQSGTYKFTDSWLGERICADKAGFSWTGFQSPLFFCGGQNERSKAVQCKNDQNVLSNPASVQRDMLCPWVKNGKPSIEPTNNCGACQIDNFIDADRNRGMTAECGMAGNPINPGTGNKFQREVDYQGHGIFPLEFIRSYNSDSPPWRHLGANWTHNFDRHIAVSTFGNLTTARVWREDGNAAYFNWNQGFWQPVTQDNFGKLIQILDPNQNLLGWIHTSSEDLIETYNAAGNLTSIQNREGWTQTLNYDAKERLVSVSDDFNRSLTFEYDNKSRINKMTDPEGNVYNYLYDANHNLISVSPPDLTADPNDNPKRQYLYQNVTFIHALTGIVDENGDLFAHWEYDNIGRPIVSEHANGAEKVTVSYAANSATVTNALGKKSIYNFGIVEGRVKLTKMDGQASMNCPASNAQYTYDSKGLVSSRTDWNGNVTTYQHDARGLEISRTEAFGTPQARTITTAWHPEFRLPTLITTPNKKTELSYDDQAHLIKKTETDLNIQVLPYATNGKKRSWTYDYNDAGLLSSMDGPRQDVVDVTSYHYDADGNLLDVVNALGQKTQASNYDAHGLAHHLTAATGLVTELNYHPRLWLTQQNIKSAQGDAISTFVYDDVGQIVQRMDPNSSKIDYEYDAAHRLIAITNGAGEIAEYLRNGLGNILKTTVKNKNQIVFEQTNNFDELGRRLQQHGAQNQTTTFQYDNNGNIVGLVDPLNHTTLQNFDALDRKTLSSNALGGKTKYVYDTQDLPQSITDARNVVTKYVYDGWGRLIQQSSPDSGTTIYFYDEANNITVRIDAAGQKTNYAYDALNRITQEKSASSGENTDYVYDQNNFSIGLLSLVFDPSGTTKYSYDDRSNLIQEERLQNQSSLITQYGHDLADEIIDITYPSGKILHYQRDAANRINKVTVQNDAKSPLMPLLDNISYRFGKLLQSLDYANGLQMLLDYDLDGQVTQLQYLDPNNNFMLRDSQLDHDDAGNVSVIADAVDVNFSENFSYDNMDRLVGGNGNYGKLAFTYDLGGNRLSAKHSQGGLGETYQYAADSNRLLTTKTNKGETLGFVYDEMGNPLQQNDAQNIKNEAYGYNAQNRLSEIKSSVMKAQYYYDAFGQRTAKDVNGKIRRFAYNGQGQLTAEATSTGTVFQEYFYIDGWPLILARGKNYFFMHPNTLTAPAIVTDSAKNLVWKALYDPFGKAKLSVAKIENPLRLPGQYFDSETGWHYNYFRDYNPNTGRYLQSDPIGLRGGMNTYAYVNNNPVNYVDPLGLYQVCHRKLLVPLPYARHCYVKFEDGTSSSYDDKGVGPDPDLNQDGTICTNPQEPEKDDCIKKNMQKCDGANYHFTKFNCCHCAEQAMKECDTSIPRSAWPNWPINPGPQPGEPEYSFKPAYGPDLGGK